VIVLAVYSAIASILHAGDSPATPTPLRIEVENRYDVTDLKGTVERN